MARFKYLGEVPPHGGFIISQGPCKQIILPKKDGTYLTIHATDQTNGFPLGQDIGVDITDTRSIRVLQADVRFQQIS